MSILPIVLFPDPMLRRPCTPVAVIDDRIRQLAADMLETMYAAPGRGLAGPQVAVPLRIFVMDVTWKEGTPSPRVCINPVILDASETQAENTEGCLSIPGIPAQVSRPDWIVLRYTDLAGQEQTERLTGFEAVAAQHELDHLNGRLCIDLMDEDSRTKASPALAAMGAPA
ncbi:peptide deformylase [Pararhodobacter aggregans]|uniref:Peptide deformylase n=1 Tax=Pararhodobacter aggregans TaxID=404875 RepID=A0A2T7ULJ7_9RHOB|nr:peptide deformylase [Pararhodobacter aggregans]PTW99815.1 peptide deformylase [Pararhodobacter aggregans]PVE45518.1 peptide deformylase [Pararhodobacter aggregans]